jgi:DNA-binding response OmpR family regulator
MENQAEGRTVLVAEDDPDTREIVKWIIEEAGYRVVVAVDGREALEKASVYRPDVAVLDVMMPEVHGYSVCHRIKSSKLLEKTKVIMLTVKTSLADRRQAKEAGADAFLAKPIHAHLVQRTIQALLSAAPLPFSPEAAF